jgi:hypothetical protein
MLAIDYNESYLIENRRNKMGTRSTIAIQKTDGSVEQIYCHWDGYLDHNGAILKTYYKTPAEVKRLIRLGDLSSLGIRVDPINDHHAFDTPEKDTCVYYGRDRGEPDTSFRKFEDMIWFRLNGQWEEYNYLYVESEQHWYLLSQRKGFLDLREFLQDLDETVDASKGKPTNLIDFIEFYKNRADALRDHDGFVEAKIIEGMVADLEKILGF